MSRYLPAIALAIAAALAACGSSSKEAGDADASDAVEDAWTPDPADDAGDVPPGDPAEDAVDDGVEDAVDDPAGDAVDDPAEDASLDAPADPGHEATADPGPDPGDVVSEDGCPALGATITSAESWVICFMGSGTAVAFTIAYSNTTSSCTVTNVTVTGGDLKLASTGASVMSFGTTAPLTGFSGTVAAGGTATADYVARDSSLDTSAHDGASMYVTVDVSYDTPYSTRTLSLTSSDFTHTCVY